MHAIAQNIVFTFLVVVSVSFVLALLGATVLAAMQKRAEPKDTLDECSCNSNDFQHILAMNHWTAH